MPAQMRGDQYAGAGMQACSLVARFNTKHAGSELLQFRGLGGNAYCRYQQAGCQHP